MSVHLGRAGYELPSSGSTCAAGRIARGALVGVEETGEDLRSAIRAFLEEAPGVRKIVIFGLSEARPRLLLYACHDPAGRGPDSGQSMDSHGTGGRQAAPSAESIEGCRLQRFWERIRKSEDGYRGATRSFLRLTQAWMKASIKPGPNLPELNLKDKLMRALEVFPGPLEIILSGGDPATAIFQEAAKDRLQKLKRAERLTVMTRAKGKSRLLPQ